MPRQEAHKHDHIYEYPFITQCLLDCLPQGNAQILDRMMGIYLQVPTGSDVHIDQSMPGNLIHHVLKER